MKRTIKASPKQLTLPLEHEARYQPAEQLREELVKALGDLLLEAIGEEMTEPTSEQEDYV
jgi:hypothetical protein